GCISPHETTACSGSSENFAAAARSIGVSTLPGSTALTRIPGAWSTAIARVRLTIPPLAAAYATTPRCAASACTDAMLTIADPSFKRLRERFGPRLVAVDQEK